MAKFVGQCVEPELASGIENVGSKKQISLEKQIDGIIEVFTQNMKSKRSIIPISVMRRLII